MAKRKDARAGRPGKKKKLYRVADDLVPWLDRVLRRCFWEHGFCEDSDGTILCSINAPSGTFHKLVMRARCEKRSAETGENYITRDELADLGFKEILFGEGIGDNYCLLGDGRPDWSSV